jgi:hypothetical protein
MSNAESLDLDKIERTAGEKLFLAHLATTSEDYGLESDSQYEFLIQNFTKSKRRGISVGEELWIVHCKRAEGVDLEKVERREEKARQAASSPVKGIMTRAADRVLSLRTRDVKIH